MMLFFEKLFPIFELMAEKACRYGDIKGFKTLTKEDVVRIFEMCI